MGGVDCCSVSWRTASTRATKSGLEASSLTENPVLSRVGADSVKDVSTLFSAPKWRSETMTKRMSAMTELGAQGVEDLP